MNLGNKICSANELVASMNAGLRPKFLFFWGHTPLAGGNIGKSVFSQWFNAPFVVDQVRYPTAEHFMMAEKARLFGDEDIRSRVLAAPSPSKAKQLGRAVRGFDVFDELPRVGQCVIELAELERGAELSEAQLIAGQRRRVRGRV